MFIVTSASNTEAGFGLGLNAAVGIWKTVITVGADVLLQPPLVVTDKVTLYCPGVLKQNDAVEVLAVPAPPKSQAQLVIVPLDTVETSAKLTHTGGQPDSLSAVNNAVGSGFNITVPEPLALTQPVNVLVIITL